MRFRLRRFKKSMKELVKQYMRQYKPPQVADWVIEQAVHIQQIPAPTFSEQARADYLAAQFDTLGLENVEIDELFNVYGLLPGSNPNLPGILFMAHTDTVFPAETDLTIRRDEGIIRGPGLGDNCIGVAGMMGVAHALQQANITPACDFWFVATSREEGLGNLDGARLAYDTLKPHIGSVINVEGLAYGYVYHAGIAVRRLHITTHAEGGHSWLHFGRASAIHAIMQLGAQITALSCPAAPRTTYNIGLVEGGHSINSIATEAGMWLDLRSEDKATLTELESQVHAMIDDIRSDKLRVEVEVVGDRPAGAIQVQHPLVQGALAAMEANGTRGTLQVGSTDGNVPLSDGCPTVTVGVTRGGNAHRLDEYIETQPVADGMRHIVALALAAADYQMQAGE